MSKTDDEFQKELKNYGFAGNGDKIKCPYCNHEYFDTWEIMSDIPDNDFNTESMEYNCESCDQTFYIKKEVITTVFSSKSKEFDPF